MKSIADEIPFSEICEMLERISNSSVTSEKEAILRDYLKLFRNLRHNFRQTNGEFCEDSFYCVLRILVPQCDNGRKSYNIRTTTIGALYIKILGLSLNGDDAGKLQRTKTVGNTLDYAEVIYNIMKYRCLDAPSQLSLEEIHKLLNIISMSDRKRIDNELAKFMQIANAKEQKWFIRIILKRMLLGLGEQKIFDIYHPKAKSLFVHHSDLYKMCKAIDSGESLQLISGVIPFHHIRPMLCGRIDITQLSNILQSGTFYLETKMDGERYHIHIFDGEYKYISRNGIDYSKNFGRTPSDGNMTPFISKMFRSNINSAIFDGEMMVWDTNTSSFRVKGENIDVKSLSKGGIFRPCFVVYDILYLNGKSFLEIAYIERVNILQKLVNQQDGVFVVCQKTKVQNLEHFKILFNQAITNLEEGVVIKNQISIYKPGSRTGGWYKIKPDYIDGITSDFDLLVIGGFLNKLRTAVEKYVLGVCTKASDGAETSFHAMCTVQSGLSTSNRELLNSILQPHWRSDNWPTCLEWGKIKPDVWINPEKSVILQIRATEIVENASYRTAHTLRFPRVDTIRRDKIWLECMTLEEFQELCKGDSNVNKIAKRGLNYNDLSLTKKSKLENLKTNPYTSTWHPDKVNKVSEIFNGLSICILSVYKKGETSIEKLRDIILKHGGRIVENPTTNSKSCFCIAGDTSIRVKKIQETGSYNIVSLDWILRVFKDNEININTWRPKPRDMISVTLDMKDELKELFDIFGDSYTDKVDEEELKTIMNDMDIKNLQPLLLSEIIKVEQNLHENGNPNLFRGFCGYFYVSSKNSNNMSSLAQLIFESRGGQSMDSHLQISFIFIDILNVNKLELRLWLNKYLANKLNEVKVMSIDWIFECDRKNQNVSIFKFIKTI